MNKQGVLKWSVYFPWAVLWQCVHFPSFFLGQGWHVLCLAKVPIKSVCFVCRTLANDFEIIAFVFESAP